MKNENYMNDIYEIIYAPEVEYNEDGIEYLDEPDDDMYYGCDDELAWADDITYLDEPYEEEFDLGLDLGEGFIPLPQGDYQQEELVVIDECYVLDEYEEDLIDNYVRPSLEDYQEVQYSMDDIYNLLDGADEIELNIDEAESLIKFPVSQELEEELQVTDMNEEDDKLAKSIAREHMDNVKAGEAVGAIFGENETPEDDTSWVDGEDLFGNDINVIIADDPNKEVVEDDFVEGSFQDWLEQQNQ